MAYILQGRPAENFTVVAITGTSGVELVGDVAAHLLASAGVLVGQVGRQGVRLGGEIKDTSSLSTMNTWKLYKSLAFLAHQGAKVVILEVVPDLPVFRLSPIRFNSCIVTEMLTLGDVGLRENSQMLIDLFSVVRNTKDGGLVVLNAQMQNLDWVNQAASQLPQKLFASWSRVEQVSDWTQSFTGMDFNLAEQRFHAKLFGTSSLIYTMLALQYVSHFVSLPSLVTSLNEYIPPSDHFNCLSHSPLTVICDRQRIATEFVAMFPDISQMKDADQNLIVVGGLDSRDDIARGLELVKNADVLILAPRSPLVRDLGPVVTEFAVKAEQFGVVLVERFTSLEEFELADKQKLLERIHRVQANGDKPVVSFEDLSVQCRQLAIRWGMELAKTNDIFFVSGKCGEGNMQFLADNSVFTYDELDYLHRLNA